MRTTADSLFALVKPLFDQVKDVWLVENKSEQELAQLIQTLLKMREAIRPARRDMIANYVVTQHDLETSGALKIAFLACLVDGPMVLYKNLKIGYGLFTEKRYDNEEFITEYGGISLTMEDLEAPVYRGDYVMTLNTWHIDGRYNFRISQKGRWINEPNLVPLNYNNTAEFERAIDAVRNCAFRTKENRRGVFLVNFREGPGQLPADAGNEIFVQYGHGRGGNNQYQRPWREALTVEALMHTYPERWIQQIHILEARRDTLVFKLFMQRVLSRRQKWSAEELAAPVEREAGMELLENIVEIEIQIPLTEVGKANVREAVQDDLTRIYNEMESLAIQYQTRYLADIQEELFHWERDKRSDDPFPSRYNLSPEESQIINVMLQSPCMQHIKNVAIHLATTTPSPLIDPDDMMMEFFRKIFETYYVVPLTEKIEEFIIYKLQNEFEINVSRIWQRLGTNHRTSIFQLFFPEIEDDGSILDAVNAFCEYIYKNQLVRPLAAELKKGGSRVTVNSYIHIYTLATFFHKDSVKRQINSLFKEKKTNPATIRGYLLFELATRTFEWAEEMGKDIEDMAAGEILETENMEDGGGEGVIDEDDLINVNVIKEWAKKNASNALEYGNAVLSTVYEDLATDYADLVQYWDDKGRGTHDGVRADIEKLSFYDVLSVFKDFRKKLLGTNNDDEIVKTFNERFKEASGTSYETRQRKKPKTTRKPLNKK